MSRAMGQFHVAEAPSAMLSLHFHTGAKLQTVDHEPKMSVLEQENFSKQGINTSTLVNGAPRVDALGNCVYNAGTVALSNVRSLPDFQRITGVSSYADVVSGEKFAIRSYHLGTLATGTPSQEWPPTDCGSSGPYLVEYLKSIKAISGQRIAHGAQNLVSLLQSDGVCQGGPFLNAWMEPDSNGFVDGDGSASTLAAQIKLGSAGGHETYQSAIEKLSLSRTGVVIPEKTVIRVRNSWGPSFGDHGSFRIHLSTLMALGSFYDFRQITA